MSSKIILIILLFSNAMIYSMRLPTDIFSVTLNDTKEPLEIIDYNENMMDPQNFLDDKTIPQTIRDKFKAVRQDLTEKISDYGKNPKYTRIKSSIKKKHNDWLSYFKISIPYELKYGIAFPTLGNHLLPGSPSEYDIKDITQQINYYNKPAFTAYGLCGLILIGFIAYKYNPFKY